MIWHVPVSWLMFSVMEVEAPTLKEAFDKMDGGRFPDDRIPEDMEYIDGSLGPHFMRDEIDFVRTYYNDGQADEVT